MVNPSRLHPRMTVCLFALVAGSVIALLLPACVPEPDGPGHRSMFETVSGTPDVLASGVFADDEIIRSRLAKWDMQQFQRQILEAPTGTRVSLELFPDVEVRSVTRSIRNLAGDGLRWKATDREVHYSDISLLVSPSAVMGQVRTDDQIYEIAPASPGVVRIAQLDPARFRACGARDRPPGSRPLDPSSHADDSIRVLILLPQSTYPELCADQIPYVDVLEWIRDAYEDEINTVFSAVNPTGVESRVRIDCVEFDPDQNIRITLDRLQQDPNVLELGELHRADVTTLIVPDAPLCAVSTDSYIDLPAYAVVRGSCALNHYSFVHAIGHHLRLRHERSTYTLSTEGRCNFAKRFAIDATHFSYQAKTVMAVTCPDCPRMGVLSQPETFESGALRVGPLGRRCGATSPSGESSGADNRGELIRNAPYVAAAR